jgi:hypothetical protein
MKTITVAELVTKLLELPQDATVRLIDDTNILVIEPVGSKTMEDHIYIDLP